MFDVLYTVSSSVAVSTASKLLNILFEELNQSPKNRNRRLVASSEALVRNYSERLKEDDLAIQLYKEILDNRTSNSLKLSEQEVEELTKTISNVIKTRLIEDGKVDQKRGRKLLENLRNTIP